MQNTEPKTTQAIIAELFEHSFDFSELPHSDSLEIVAAAYRKKRKADVDPLLIFVNAVDAVMPVFVLNLLANMAGKQETAIDPNERDNSADAIAKREELASLANNRPLLIDTLKEYLEGVALPDIHHEWSELELQTLALEILSFNFKIFQTLDFIYLRMARSSSYVPGFLLSKLTQTVLTPYIVAQVTRHLDHGRAASLAVHFKHTFLADVTMYLEPKQIARIAEVLSDKILVKVIETQIEYGRFQLMAQITEYLRPQLAGRIFRMNTIPHNIASVFAHIQNPEVITDIKQHYPLQTRRETMEELEKLNRSMWEKVNESFLS